jgi:hypothetical protein
MNGKRQLRRLLCNGLNDRDDGECAVMDTNLTQGGFKAVMNTR